MPINLPEDLPAVKTLTEENIFVMTHERAVHQDIRPFRNYFSGDDPAQRPISSWISHATLLFTNWLNYYVYQRTPFDLKELR